jgi:ferredoxin
MTRKRGPAVARYEIRFKQDLCTGCLRCGLACSDLYIGSFCPDRAYIQVEEGEAAYTVRFSEDCTECGACADSCFYEALEKIALEAQP